MSDIFALFDEEPAPAAPAPIPDDPREAFVVLDARLDALRSMAPFEALQARFEAEVRATYVPKGKKKGKEFSLSDARDAMGQAYFDILARYEAEAEALVETTRAEKDKVGEQLDQLAEKIPVTSEGADWRQADSVSSSDYSTQTDSHGYARRSAEMKVLHYRHAGLEAEVRRTLLRDKHPGDPFFAKSGVTYYEVWVRASELDVKVAKRKGGPTLKEQLQWAWDNGVNPRVFNPWLPHGLEERLGVKIGGMRRG